jgi:hypothetical protein
LVKFNVDAVPGFLGSVQYLGELAANEIFDGLEHIESQKLGWVQFVTRHGWTPVEKQPPDTYPGADPMYWFGFDAPSGTRYQIAAKGPDGTVVFCAIAAQSTAYNLPSP